MSLVIGYGSFTPTSTFERVVALFCMMLAGSIYAYIIGAICQVRFSEEEMLPLASAVLYYSNSQ